MPSTSRSRSAGPSRVGRPAGISPVVGTPRAGSPSSGCRDDRKRNDPERDRLSRQQALAEHEQHDRDDADGKHEVMHLAELPGEQHRPLKKIVPAAGHAKQARQLGHGDGQPRAGLEAHEDAVADQLHERAQSQHPSEHAKRGHSEACEARDLCIALRVAVRHRPHRAGNHERDGGGRSDRQLTRRPEQGVAEPAQQVAVDADLRRQAGKSGIGERNRDRVGRQRHAGDDVTTQPGRTVFRQPTRPAESAEATSVRSGAPTN